MGSAGGMACIRRILGSAAVAGLLVASGCQALLGIEDTRVAEGEIPDAPGTPGFSFAVLTTSVSLPLDGTGAVDVQITRTGGFDGAVEVKPAFLPSGLVAPAVVIPAGQSSAELAVGAVAPLVLGGTLDFQLQASSGDLPIRTVEISKAQVTGRPATFDSSFGGAGSGQLRVSFVPDDGGYYQRIYFTGDGSKLVAIGEGQGGLGSISYAVARLSLDGVLDATFAPSNTPPGQLRISFAGTSGEGAHGVALGFQVDGRMIAIGGHQNGSLPPDVGLARLSVTGGLGGSDYGNQDPGKSRLDLGGDEEISDGLVLRSGATIAVGTSRSAGGSDDHLVVMRATSDGFLDGDFNGTGTFKLTDPVATRADAVVLDAKDRLVVAGFIGPPGQRDMLILRLDAAGALDPSFGTGGRVVLGTAGADERARAIAVRSDGRLVIAGHSNKNGNDDFELRQLLENGQPDESFGQGGVSTPPITAGHDRVAGMALLPNGRIVVVGNSGRLDTDNDAFGSPIMARYTRAGALDPSFSADGIDAVPFGGNGVLRGVLVPPDGRKVFLCGGDQGASPGPGTYGVIARMWM